MRTHSALRGQALKLHPSLYLALALTEAHGFQPLRIANGEGFCVNSAKQERAEIVDKQRKIMDGAAEAKRKNLTSEEEESYQKLEKRFDELSHDIRGWELSQKEAALQAAASAPNLTSINTPRTSPQNRRERLVPEAVQTKEYRNAWEAHFGRRLKAEPKREHLAALEAGEGSEGGFILAPVEFDTELDQKVKDLVVMRDICDVKRYGATNIIPIESSRVSAAWIAEEGTYPTSDPSFGSKKIEAHKGGLIVKVSDELLKDAYFDLVGYLTDEFADALAELEEPGFISGDGVGKPMGVLVDAELGKSFASASAITADELIDLAYALKRQYRRRATWLTSDAMVKIIRKLKGSDNNYLWQPGLRGDEPDILLNRPIAVTDSMPAVATGNKSIAIGDFKRYRIADRGMFEMLRLDEKYADTGHVGFRGHRRVDGKLLRSEAVKYGQQA